LLVIALIADSLIGYKITYSLYLYAFDAGHTNRNWEVTDVFIDPNFYLVLVLGFFVYVIWGFLLNFILGHPLFKTESEIVMNINKKISEKRNIIQEQLEKILKTENEIEICNIMISEKESIIIDYQYGNIPMDISKPRGAVSEFMKGWQAYVINSREEDEAVRLINEAIITQKNWLTQKTEITKIKKI
jgi:hypothetical protein